MLKQKGEEMKKQDIEKKRAEQEDSYHIIFVIRVFRQI